MGFTGVGLGLPKDWIHIYLIKKKIRRWSTGIFLLKESISFSGSHFPNVSSSLKRRRKKAGRSKIHGPHIVLKEHLKWNSMDHSFSVIVGSEWNLTSNFTNNRYSLQACSLFVSQQFIPTWSFMFSFCSSFLSQ